MTEARDTDTDTAARLPRIAVFGLGKLGSPMAATFAAAGFATVGCDVNPAFVEAVANGRAPVPEPRLQETLDRGRERLTATADARAAVLASDVSFVIVPTPSGPERTFVNDWVIEAVTAIGEALRETPERHVVVITSTVMPGSTGGPIRAALEAASGKTAGEDVGLVYNPEFVALGTVIRDTLEADLILIGESDPASGDLVEAIQRTVVRSAPQVHRMGWESAEVTKLALNTFVTTKISYANMIADVCERIPGADARAVTAALGADSRIGPKYLTPAVGYGGPCFPRDNKAFAAMGRRLGANTALAEATDEINDRQVERLRERVRGVAPAGGTVAVLGMTYKPGTGVIEASQGVMLAEALLADGYRVRIADPQGGEAAAVRLGGRVQLLPVADALRGVDAAVVVTPWPEFAGALRAARDAGELPVLVDPWRLLPAEETAIEAEPRDVGQPGIEDVAAYWNARPCNIRHSRREVGSREYFEEVERRKYLVEPHIPGFADFERWRGKRVLDVGCGIGTIGAGFARAGAEYVGLELSEVSLDLARQRFDTFGLPGQFVLGNAEHLDRLVEPASFDLVFSFGVIHHTVDPKAVIAAARRAIRPDGELRIMVYARNSWKAAMIEAGLDQPEAQSGCPIALTYDEAGIADLLGGRFVATDIRHAHIFPYVVEKYVEHEYELQPWFAAMPPEMFAALEERLGWHLLVTAKPV